MRSGCVFENAFQCGVPAPGGSWGPRRRNPSGSPASSRSVSPLGIAPQQRPSAVELESSSEHRLSCSPQIAPIFRPAAVDPVKATLSTPG